MAKILFISSHPEFAADLRSQLELYAEEFDIYDEYSPENVFEAALVDEDCSQLTELLSVLHHTPLFFLTSGDCGAISNDDSVHVIRKPFRLESLLDELHSGINTSTGTSAELVFNIFRLDAAGKAIVNMQNDEVIKLTEREIAILKYLYKAQDKIVDKAELLSEVWGYNPEATTHTVETHIYRLRQKVEHDDNNNLIIITEDNGYKLKLK